jgi:para-nitrobenzyl esterase
MSSVLIAFARTGDPNNPAIPHWHPFDLATRETLVFDRTPRIEADPYREIRELWANMPPAQSVLG